MAQADFPQQDMQHEGLFLRRCVLIIGSGLTYHNMRGFGRRESTTVADAFEGYLNLAITQRDPIKRNEMLVDGEKGPGSRWAHPQEDQLVPLMVVAGASGNDVGHRLFVDHVMGVFHGIVSVRMVSCTRAQTQVIDNHITRTISYTRSLH